MNLEETDKVVADEKSQEVDSRDEVMHIEKSDQWFLQGVSVAASPVLATIGMSVRPSVCLSHAGTEWKRRKLGSRNLHRRIAQGL